MTSDQVVLIVGVMTTLGTIMAAVATIIGAKIQARAHRDRVFKPEPMRAAAHDPSSLSPRTPIPAELPPENKYLIVGLSVISAIFLILALVVAAVPIADRNNWLVVGHFLLLGFVTGGVAWSLNRPVVIESKEVLRWKLIAWTLGQTVGGAFAFYFVLTLSIASPSMSELELKRAFAYSSAAVLCYLFFSVALTILIRPPHVSEIR